MKKRIAAGVIALTVVFASLFSLSACKLFDGFFGGSNLGGEKLEGTYSVYNVMYLNGEYSAKTQIGTLTFADGVTYVGQPVFTGEIRYLLREDSLTINDGDSATYSFVKKENYWIRADFVPSGDVSMTLVLCLQGTSPELSDNLFYT